jgi:ABC-type Na+ efflux pump, permease component
MKQLLNVIKFETQTYFQSKGFRIGTIVLAAVFFIGLFIPSFIDLPFLQKNETSAQISSVPNEKLVQWGIFDDSKQIDNDIFSFSQIFPTANITTYTTEADLKEGVRNNDIEAGFILHSLTNYTYVINNSVMYDSTQMLFEEYFISLYRSIAFTEQNIDYNQVVPIIYTPVTSNQEILGTDGVGGYLYAYILVFLIYFITILYGQSIATSVTSEKSNRAIEVLVTSTSSNSLIFGKVIAGALSTLFQVGLILGSAVISYRINRDAWGGILDILFDIPGKVLIVFALFGILGYLFSALFYAALGALVSKTEDIGKSVMPIMIILMVGFFISISGMNAPDSSFVVIGSFVPFVSFYLMIVRAAMGTVQIWEIIVSLLILIGTNIVVGLLVAKIYRLGTLMIGNPIKLSSAFKMLKQERKK